ncbi:MAG: Nif3-like dinuclear metal center hexameric protein [Cytophagaceae bacterium]|nr:Nif3-like dinuclear metal center hexameric protein [Cytophagaceae bacterium]MDW8457186.1 Nif3-like dinuclear metal center hexameric protein [Cytophagaceae bacterium]
MTKIKEVIQWLESSVPCALQEDYDNCGLITGNANQEITGINICLDVTEKVIEESIASDCNLIISHHPVVFRGLKKINGNHYVERILIQAIKNDIAIYALHTNLDNVHYGVNKKIADIIGITDTRILAPKSGLLKKMVTYVPKEQADTVLKALYAAGAGNIGNYSECSFQLDGVGTFKPNEQANPTLGSANMLEYVQEKRVEVIFPSYLQRNVTTALYNAHPYEEPAYDIIPLSNEHALVGAGMIGTLTSPMSETEFLQLLKTRFNLSCIRHTKLLNKPVVHVAVCGGSGSFLTQQAIAERADVFVSSDFKYHDFFEADEKILIADIGHYESEAFTKELIYEIVIKKFTNIALRFSKVNTNPISYFN